MKMLYCGDKMINIKCNFILCEYLLKIISHIYILCEEYIYMQCNAECLMQCFAIFEIIEKNKTFDVLILVFIDSIFLSFLERYIIELIYMYL